MGVRGVIRGLPLHPWKRLEPGAFVAALSEVQEDAVAQGLEADPLGQVVVEFVDGDEAWVRPRSRTETPPGGRHGHARRALQRRRPPTAKDPEPNPAPHGTETTGPPGRSRGVGRFCGGVEFSRESGAAVAHLWRQSVS